MRYLFRAGVFVAACFLLTSGLRLQAQRGGGSATVHYRLTRSSDARPGTTHLRFSIVLHDPHMAVTECSGMKTTYRIDV